MYNQFKVSSILCRLLIFLNLLFLQPSIVSAHGHVLLDEVEETAQVPFYSGNDVKEFLEICQDADGDYDFEDPSCIANRIQVLQPNDPRYQALQLERQEQLAFAVTKVKDFHTRLNNQGEFIAQVLVFLLPLIVGIHLVYVGHFDIRTLYDRYAIDNTFGMPCWQYLRMKYAVVKIQLAKGERNVGAAAAESDDEDYQNQKPPTAAPRTSNP